MKEESVDEDDLREQIFKITDYGYEDPTGQEVTQSDIKNHYLSQEQLKAMECLAEIESNYHKCFYCPANFRSHSRFVAHLQSHSVPSEKKIYACSLCPKSFKHSTTFLRHTDDHQNFKCHQCQKSSFRTEVHAPEFTEKSEQCQFFGCSNLSIIKCKKCNLYLCLKQDSNCFSLYHNTVTDQ